MKKVLLFLCAFLLVFSFSGVASATIMEDIVTFNDGGTVPFFSEDDYGWGEYNKLDGVGDFVAYTHYFSFWPAVESFNSATLTLYLRDDNDWRYEYGIVFEEFVPNVLGFTGGDGSFAFDANIDFLSNNEYSVILASGWGDFYIDASKLSVDYNPVPEPGTIVLMGLGLVGLAGMGRKKLFKK